MNFLKMLLLLIAVSFVFSTGVTGQEQTPGIYLETHEKCNNYQRHFCLNGSHEASVNRILLDMKRKGRRISEKLIKTVARSTPSRLRNPVAGMTQ